MNSYSSRYLWKVRFVKIFGKTLKMSVYVHEMSKSTEYACPAQMSTNVQTPI